MQMKWLKSDLVWVFKTPKSGLTLRAGYENKQVKIKEKQHKEGLHL